MHPGDSAIVCEFCGTNLRVTASGEIMPFFDSTPGEVDPNDPLAQAAQLVAAGQKIEAIKLLRRHTNLGLKEAKDLADELERGGRPAISPAPGASGANPDWAKIRNLLDQGKKIEAVRVYRQATGAGLKQSKGAVEAYAAGLGPAQSTAAAAKPAGSGSCLPGCLGFLVVIFLALAGCGVSVNQNDLYTCAIRVIASDSGVQDTLGSPVRGSIPLVVGYSAESDFGGNSRLSFQLFSVLRGPQDRALFYISALNQANGFYWVQANPFPNPKDMSVVGQGRLAGCLE